MLPMSSSTVVGHLSDREVLFPRSSMSQNRGLTRGFVAIERFLILMIYSRLCRNSEVVAIQRCRNWEVALYLRSITFLSDMA